jgi:hypothetical protein
VPMSGFEEKMPESGFEDKMPERAAATKAAWGHYGVVYLVAKTGISSQQAMSLVDRFGLDFDRMEFEAGKMTSTSRSSVL